MMPSARGPLLFSACFAVAAVDFDVVHTALGPVKGIRSAATRTFRGIPFARPPVAELRWRAPQPVQAWGPRELDATGFGHSCYQHDNNPSTGLPHPPETFSEDCLTLNIYAGLPEADAELKPVLFWIHGGGYATGGGNETRLNGTWDVSLLRGEIVIVTSNYRLNVFGFASSEALLQRGRREAPGDPEGTGNYGILDQRAALQWVSNHIADFGGDPSRVMIVGHSAGANSVSQHLVRRRSWGLFSSAGMESGAFYEGLHGPTVQSQAGRWQDMVEAAGCSPRAGGNTSGGGDEAVACLLKTPAEVLLSSSGGGWVVTVDGEELPKAGPLLASAGQLAPVPIFVGSVSEDISPLHSSCKPANCTREDFIDAIKRAGYSAAAGEQLASLYSHDPARPGKGSAWDWAIMHAGADEWGTCAARRMARWYARIGMPSFWYYWSYIPDGDTTAHHSIDQPFVFHVLSETPTELLEEGRHYQLSRREVNFSASIVRMWAAMASTGRPNTSEVMWPPFTASPNGTALLLEGGAGVPGHFNVQGDFSSAKCDFWDSMFGAIPRKAPHPADLGTVFI